MKWKTSWRLLSSVIEGGERVALDSVCNTLVTQYSLLILLVQDPFILTFLFYFSVIGF